MQYLNEALFIGIELSRVPTHQSLIEKIEKIRKENFSGLGYADHK